MGKITGPFMKMFCPGSLLIAPAADRTADTAAVFQESSIFPESFPVEFRLKSVERAGKDGVHLFYSVNSPR